MQNINKTHKTLASLIEKLRTPTWQFTMPLFLLLGFLPIRILTLLCVDPVHKNIVFYTGLVLICFFAFFMNHVVPYLLNNMVVQFLFFNFLRLENFIYSSSSRLEAFWLSLSTCLSILLLPVVLFGPFLTQLTWYLLVYMIAFTCYRLRAFFVVPSENLVTDMIENGYLKPIDEAQDFDWSVVIFNMNKVSQSLYKLPVENRLGSRLANLPMKQVGIRYITNWFSRGVSAIFESAGARFGREVAESIRKDPAVKVGASIAGAVGTYGLKRELDIKQMDAETSRMNAETKRIQVEADAKANLINAEANLKNAETYRMQFETSQTPKKPPSGWFFWGNNKNKEIGVDPKASVTKTKALSIWEESLFYKAKGYALHFFYYFF